MFHENSYEQTGMSFIYDEPEQFQKKLPKNGLKTVSGNKRMIVGLCKKANGKSFQFIPFAL
jgi:hypothetical protein